MGKRVPVVEDGASPSFALIGRDHVGLDPHTGRDPLFERHLVEPIAAEEVVLRHLADSTAELAGRQGRQHLGVADHRDGLPERTHKILSFGKVDTGLAPDRGIDLAEQRGRHAHEADSPVVHRGHEAGEIGDDSPTDTDDHIGAREPGLGHLPTHLLHDGERFGRFAVGHGDDDMVAARIDLPRNRGLGDHGDPRRPRGDDLGKQVTYPGAHVDRIAAVVQLDVHGDGHADTPSSAATIASTQSEWRISDVSTLTSATAR